MIALSRVKLALLFPIFISLTPTFASENNALPISATSTLSDTLTRKDTSTLTQFFQDQLPTNSTQPALADSLIHYAKRFLGIRYQSGGRSKRGFDCSGFTSFIYSKFGLSLPHSSASQSKVGQPVSKAEVQKGDLIFFKGSNVRSKQVGHVGIVVSNNDGKIRFIHASRHRGVTIDAIDSSYYRNRYIAIKRVAE